MLTLTTWLLILLFGTMLVISGTGVAQTTKLRDKSKTVVASNTVSHFNRINRYTSKKCY
jgi:hypothetical protein